MLSFSLVFGPSATYAQSVYAPLNLPLPGVMVAVSNLYAPPMLLGVKVNFENPLEMDFLIDQGEDPLDYEQQQKQYSTLIRYFLASLTIPDENLWVNLSPYEKDRIIADDFAQTQMGMDLLAQDYILKQLMASLMYPEDELGKEFWDRVYKRAYEEFGTTEIPMDTFNKVWIVPDEAIVYEGDDTAWVLHSRLKVMLEEDYLASAFAKASVDKREAAYVKSEENDFHISKQIIKEIIIPEIEREVNEGAHFAQLRQIYHSMILATWYKRTLQKSVLGQVYVNKGKVAGVDARNKEDKLKIYNQYLEAFKVGVFNYIKEDVDPLTKEIIPRKYFSGGFAHEMDNAYVGIKSLKEVSSPLRSKILERQRGIQERGIVSIESVFEMAKAASPVEITDYSNANIETLLGDYYLFKQNLLKDLDQNQSQEALQAYRQMLQVVEPLSEKVSVTKNKKLEDALKTIVQANNIHPHLVSVEGFSMEGIRQELQRVGHKEFRPKTQELIDSLLQELSEELGKNEKEQKILKQLRDSIRPMHISNYLPEDVFKNLLKNDREKLMGYVLDLPRAMQVYGSMDSDTRLIQLNDFGNTLTLRKALIHELTHLLSDMGIFHIPAEWENITYAVDVIEHVKHFGETLQEGEDSLKDTTDEYGPAVVELYQRGKELGLKDETGFIIKPGISDNKAGYFAMDYLLMEAREIYEKLGLNTDLFQMMNHEASYAAQMSVGVMLSGIFMGMSEKDANFKPMRALRDFFDVLYERYGDADEGNIAWQNFYRNTLEDMKKYASAKAVRYLEFKEKETGFWSYDPSQKNSLVEFVKTDFKLRGYDGANNDDFANKAKAAYERVLGQVTMLFGFQDSDIIGWREQVPEKIKNHPAFDVLWKTLLIPMIIDFTAFDQKPSTRWVKRVLRDRYDIGQPWVEKGLYNGLPSYLQYLDSLLYMRYHYDQETQKTSDPRMSNKKVSRAIDESMGSFDIEQQYGWAKILYFSNEIKDTQFVDTITNTIWPRYLELYDEALEKEELYKAYQKMMEEEKKEMLTRPSFEQMLTATLMQQIQQYMDSLPEEERQKLQEEAEKNVNQDMQNFGNFSQPAGAMGENSSLEGQGQGQSISSLGQGGQPFQGLSQSMDPQDLEDVVNDLEKQLENMSSGMKELGNTVNDIKSQSNDVPTSDVTPQDNKNAQGSAERIEDQVKQIQNMANQALNEGRSVVVQSSQQNQMVNDAVNSLPSNDTNLDAKDTSDQVNEKTRELLGKLQELQNKANELLESAKALSETVNHPESKTDGSKTQAAVENLENALNNVSNQASEAMGQNRDIQRGLEQLQNSIGKIQEAMNESQSQGQKGNDRGGFQSSDNQDGSQAGELGGSQKDSSSGSSDQSSELQPSTGSGKPVEEQSKFTPTSHEIYIPNAMSLNDEFEKPSAPKIEPAQAKPFDLIADKQRQEDLIKDKTGLSLDEYAEFKSWYKIEITENGKTIRVEELIKELTKAMRLFLLPHKGLNLQADLKSGPILHDPVKALVSDLGFATVKKKYPKTFYFTIMGDVSGSMDNEILEGSDLRAIDIERIIQFVFINSFLQHNKERANKGKAPIAFEIGLWSDDSKTPPMISHETTRKENFKKERVMYDIWKATETAGGTSYADNLRYYVRRLINAQSADKEGIRVLMVISDEQVYDQEKQEILGIIDLAKKNGIHLFVIPMGNAQQIQETKNLHQVHPEQIIEPSPYVSLIDRSMGAFVDTIGGELTKGQDWHQIVNTLSRSSSPIETRFGELTDIPGFKYFKTQTINGWPYLVYDRDGRKTEYFPQGFGGANVPTDMITETDETLEKILEVLRAMFRPDTMPNFPYSPDGKYLARFAHNGNVEIDIQQTDGTYKWLMDMDPFELMDKKEDNLFETVHQKLQIQMNDLTGQVAINQNTDHFVDIDGFENLDLKDWLFYEQDTNQIVVYHRPLNQVYVLTRKGGDNWKILHSLTLQKESRGEAWDPQYVNFTGDPGVGKTKTGRVVANLLNIPYLSDTGHADLTLEDLTTAHRSINSSETGYEESMLNVIKHHGFIGVYEEVHKFDPDVWNAIKSTISERTHLWAVTGKDGVTRLEKMPDHPLARLFTTGNEKRDGIEGSNWTHNNAPIQERKENVHFYRQSPQSEIDFQTDLALKLVDKLEKYKNDSDGLRIFETRLREDIKNLVEVGSDLYLRFKGYNPDQKDALHKDWRLIDPKYLATQIAINPDIARIFPDAGPESNPGEFLKRAPSPRVIENIIAHFVRNEKDREYRSLTTIKNYFNFEAEIDDGKTYAQALLDFGEKFEDKDHPPLEFNKDSFEVKDKSLVLTPVNEQYWDALEVPLHSRASIRLGDIPSEVKEWFGWFSGNENISDSLKEFFHENVYHFYLALQAYSSGMDLIFVGDPGTGKSTAIDAIQALVNAPGHLKYNINQQTRVDQITFTKEIVKGETYYIPQVLVRAMNEKGEGQMLNLDESSQGRNEMLSFQNTISEYRIIKDPRNNNKPLDGARGFGITHTINIPGSADGVNSFPDDFIERHMVLKFNNAPPQVVAEYLEMASKRIMLPHGRSRRINERLIGEEIGQYQNPTEPKYDGIVGLFQSINRRQKLSKDILPARREISPRVLQKFVKHLLDRYESQRDMGKKPQEIFLDTFVQAFTLEGESPQEITQWKLKLIDEFEKVGLFSKDADKDGIIEFLGGDDNVVTDDLKPFYEPQLENEELSKLLVDLQITMNAGRIRNKLKTLSERMDELLSQDKWKKRLLIERLETVNVLRELYKALGFIHDYRKNVVDGLQLSTVSLKDIQLVQGRVNQLVSVFNWPQEVLEEIEGPLGLKNEILEQISIGQKDLDEQILRIMLFADIDNYRQEQMDQLIKGLLVERGNDIEQLHKDVDMLAILDKDLFKDVITALREKIKEINRLVAEGRLDLEEDSIQTKIAQKRTQLAEIQKEIQDISAGETISTKESDTHWQGQKILWRNKDGSEIVTVDKQNYLHVLGKEDENGKRTIVPLLNIPRVTNGGVQEHPEGVIITHVAKSQDGKRVVSVDDTGKIVVWDVETGNKIDIDSALAGTHIPKQYVIKSVRFSPDNKKVIILRSNSSVAQIIDISRNQGELLPSPFGQQKLDFVDFHVGMEAIILISGKGDQQKIELLNPQTKRPLEREDLRSERTFWGFTVRYDDSQEKWKIIDGEVPISFSPVKDESIRLSQLQSQSESLNQQLTYLQQVTSIEKRIKKEQEKLATLPKNNQPIVYSDSYLLPEDDVYQEFSNQLETPIVLYLGPSGKPKKFLQFVEYEFKGERRIVEILNGSLTTHRGSTSLNKGTILEYTIRSGEVYEIDVASEKTLRGAMENTARRIANEGKSNPGNLDRLVFIKDFKTYEYQGDIWHIIVFGAEIANWSNERALFYVGYKVEGDQIIEQEFTEDQIDQATEILSNELLVKEDSDGNKRYLKKEEDGSIKAYGQEQVAARDKSKKEAQPGLQSLEDQIQFYQEQRDHLLWRVEGMEEEMDLPLEVDEKKENQETSGAQETDFLQLQFSKSFDPFMSKLIKATIGRSSKKYPNQIMTYVRNGEKRYRSIVSGEYSTAWEQNESIGSIVQPFRTVRDELFWKLKDSFGENEIFYIYSGIPLQNELGDVYGYSGLPLQVMGQRGMVKSYSFETDFSGEIEFNDSANDFNESVRKFFNETDIYFMYEYENKISGKTHRVLTGAEGQIEEFFFDGQEWKEALYEKSLKKALFQSHGNGVSIKHIIEKANQSISIDENHNIYAHRFNGKEYDSVSLGQVSKDLKLINHTDKKGNVQILGWNEQEKKAYVLNFEDIDNPSVIYGNKVMASSKSGKIFATLDDENQVSIISNYNSVGKEVGVLKVLNARFRFIGKRHSSRIIDVVIYEEENSVVTLDESGLTLFWKISNPYDPLKVSPFSSKNFPGATSINAKLEKDSTFVKGGEVESVQEESQQPSDELSLAQKLQKYKDPLQKIIGVESDIVDIKDREGQAVQTLSQINSSEPTTVLEYLNAQDLIPTINEMFEASGDPQLQLSILKMMATQAFKVEDIDKDALEKMLREVDVGKEDNFEMFEALLQVLKRVYVLNFKEPSPERKKELISYWETKLFDAKIHKSDRALAVVVLSALVLEGVDIERTQLYLKLIGTETEFIPRIALQILQELELYDFKKMGEKKKKLFIKKFERKLTQSTASLHAREQQLGFNILATLAMEGNKDVDLEKLKDFFASDKSNYYEERLDSLTRIYLAKAEGGEDIDDEVKKMRRGDNGSIEMIGIRIKLAQSVEKYRMTITHIQNKLRQPQVAVFLETLKKALREKYIEKVKSNDKEWTIEHLENDLEKEGNVQIQRTLIEALGQLAVEGYWGSRKIGEIIKDNANKGELRRAVVNYYKAVNLDALKKINTADGKIKYLSHMQELIKFDSDITRQTGVELLSVDVTELLPPSISQSVEDLEKQRNALLPIVNEQRKEFLHLREEMLKDTKTPQSQGEQEKKDSKSSSPLQNQNPGGIDLDSRKLDLKIQGDGINFPAVFDIQPFLTDDFHGFTPVIINITPVPLPLFLSELKEPKTQELSLVQ